MNQIIRLFFLLLASACWLQLPAQIAGNCGEGTTISLANGRNQVFTCAGDDRPDILNFRTGVFYMPFALLVTDLNDQILEVTLDLRINFQKYPAGDYRVVAVYYKGILFAKPGLNARRDPLAAYCYGLTGNAVTVNHIVPEGGTIAFGDGETIKYLCPDDGKPDVVTFGTSSASRNYNYVLTDDAGNILRLLPSDTVDFETSPEGVNRIYGYSFGGDLRVAIGQPIATGLGASNCFDLSSNYLEVVKTRADGGTIRLADGAPAYRTCLNDATGGRPNLQVSTTSRARYGYVLTDQSNRVVQVFSSARPQLSGLAPGTFRLWGLSYTGTLATPLGQVATAAALTDECFDLSDNFIPITILPLDAGQVALTNGDNSTVVCLNEPNALNRNFRNTGAIGARYAYAAVAKGSNRILALSTTGQINFGNLAGDTNLVRGIAYYGTLRAQVGDDLFATILADSCYVLSKNVVEVIKKSPQGGRVSFADGSTSRLLCFGNELPTLPAITTTGGRGENYIFLLADRNNNVLTISQDGAFNLGIYEAGEYRIYGLSYTGRLAFPSGANLSTTRFSDQCFAISENALALTKVNVDGGQVRLSGNRTELRLCLERPTDTMLTVTNSAILQQQYAYLLTDATNRILSVARGNQVEFPANLEGNFRIWGVAYSGNLLARVGDVASATALSSQCWELSDNFVAILKKTNQAGTIALPSGVSSLICFGQNAPESIALRVSGSTATNYSLLVTDTANRILRVVEGTVFRPDRTLPVKIRLHGLAYSGQLTAATGALATTANLSSECFDLSNNFIALTINEVDGGRVTLSTGETQKLICIDDQPDALSFRNTASTKAQFRYLLTDAENRLLLTLIGSSVDFNASPPGNYRVWGVSFTGNFQLRPGDIVGSRAISDACFDVSDNFVSLTLERVNGGSITFDNGQSTLIVCRTGLPDVVSYQVQGAAAGAFTYVFTDNRNRILGSTTATTFNFETINEDSIRIWGLSYTGSLNLTTGAELFANRLAANCFDLSNNFATLLRVDFQGGLLRTSSGSQSVTQCPGEIATVRFLRAFQIGTTSAFVVTDSTNRIVAVSPTDTINFSNYPAGTFRVWNVAYGGTLTAAIGQNITQTALSNDCFAVSQNFVTVRRRIPRAGSIETSTGVTRVVSCPGNNTADQYFVQLRNTDQGQIAYVLTDNANIVRWVSLSPNIDFDTVPVGLYRLWGLVFNGELNNVGAVNAAAANFATSCFALSTNFIEVLNVLPDAGGVAASAIPANFCSGDGRPDPITLSLNGASPHDRAFLITNNQDELLFLLRDSNRTNLDVIPGGNVIRIYGVAYTGNLTITAGANVKNTPLTNDCADLTDNFIEVIRTEVDGGRIRTELPGDSVYVCPGDGRDDILAFTNTSQAATAGYRYVITNPANQILSIINGTRQSFENVGFRELRVWGVSFTGAFRLAAGQNITTAVAADGCYELSSNFITVFREAPNGGRIATASGADNALRFCPTRGETRLALTTTSRSRAGYAFILSDANGVVRVISNTNRVNFAGLPLGQYIITGVSYTGRLKAVVGQVFPADSLASNCFDVADNSLRVDLGSAVDGGALATAEGATEYFTCPGDTIPDVVTLLLPTAIEGSEYRVVITDDKNRVVFPEVQNVLVDFDQSRPGVYRIWGVSLTGQPTIQFGADLLTAALSNDCYDLSSNFISVFVEAPAGGQIATATGQNAVAIVKGDAVSDVVKLQRQNAAKNAAYRYLITTGANRILAIVAQDSFDFQAFALGSYRIWGLSYTGLLQAKVGGNIATDTLSNSCFQLSTNFIAVTIANPIQEEVLGTPGAQRPVAAPTGAPVAGVAGLGAVYFAAAPNPVAEETWVTFNWRGLDQAAVELQLFNAQGGLVQRYKLQANGGENRYLLSLRDQLPGIYFLRLSHAEGQNGLRLVKLGGN